MSRMIVEWNGNTPTLREAHGWGRLERLRMPPATTSAVTQVPRVSAPMASYFERAVEFGVVIVRDGTGRTASYEHVTWPGEEPTVDVLAAAPFGVPASSETEADLRFRLAELDAELARHHRDFTMISDLCAHAAEGHVSADQAIATIRNIVG